jgi:hypothetical protein
MIPDSHTLYIPSVLSVVREDVHFHLSMPSIAPSVDYMLLKQQYVSVVHGHR